MTGGSMQHPDDLLAGLKLGREEYCQRLLTMLIVGGPYPKWNTRSAPSAAGRRFLTLLEELSFGQALSADEAEFVDEFDLGRRPSDLKGSAPDWALFTEGRLGITELKSERGSHREAQVPTYVATGRHYYPDLAVDLTYITGPMARYAPPLPDGTRYAHLLWEEVLPLVREAWNGGSDAERAAVSRLEEVLGALATPWRSWREARLGVPPTEPAPPAPETTVE